MHTLMSKATADPRRLERASSLQQSGQTLRASDAGGGWTWGLALIYSLMTAYMVCHATQAPMLPYLWSRLHGNKVLYGLLLTEFGALTLLGTILSGPLIDRAGAKLWLAISFGASSLGFMLTAVAGALWVLFLSRLPACLELGALSVRILITERSGERDRARMLGYVGGCVGIGLAVGPSIGGALTATSPQLCAWLASLAALCCIGLVPLIPSTQAQDYKLLTEELEVELQRTAQEQGPMTRRRSARPGSEDTPRASSGLLPEVGEVQAEEGLGHPGPPPLQAEAVQVRAAPAASTQLQRIIETCRQPGIPSLLCIKALMSMGLGLLQATLALSLQQHYELDPRANGLVLSYLGCLLILAEVAVVGPVSVRLTVRQVTVYFGLGTAVSFAGMAVASLSIWALVAVLPSLVTSTVLVQTISTAELTKRSPGDAKGTALALDAALLGLCSTIMPILGSVLLETSGFASIGIVGGGIILAMVCLVVLGALTV